MKKEVKTIIAVVLAVWILVMGIEIGSIREKKNIAKANATTETTTQAPQTTTEAPDTTTQAPTTTQPATPAPVIPGTSDAPVVPDTTTTAPAANGDVSSMSKDEVINKVVEYVNKVKSEQNMTCHKTENINISLTALSIEPARSVVNDAIKSAVGEPVDEVITVVNGIATYPNGSTRPVKEAIPPSNEVTKDFSLSADGVVSYKAEKQGDSTVYTVVLVEETTNASNPKPKHNSTAIGFLDLLSIELPSVITIADSNMKYPGSTVEVTVNAEGKVTKLVNKLPMIGDVSAKITLIGSGSASFEGNLDEIWEFTY